MWIILYREIISFVLTVWRNTQIKVSDKIQTIYSLNMVIHIVAIDLQWVNIH